MLATALTKDRRSGKHSVCNALFHKTDFNTVSLGGYGCLVNFLALCHEMLGNVMFFVTNLVITV